MKRAVFEYALKAQVVSQIMKFWGILTKVKGKTVILHEDSGKGGFEFFAKLYDAR